MGLSDDNTLRKDFNFFVAMVFLMLGAMAGIGAAQVDLKESCGAVCSPAVGVEADGGCFCMVNVKGGLWKRSPR